jgi:hypothetical protein
MRPFCAGEEPAEGVGQPHVVAALGRGPDLFVLHWLTTAFLSSSQPKSVEG